MPFPLSPTNGQQTTLNGVTYEYSSSNGTWTKIPATVVTSIDQIARDTANSASSNTIYTQGVDTTQNTRITAVDSYAGGAYAQSNTNASDITILQGVNATQNTNITAVNNFAAGAYNKANSADNLAQSSFDKANSANVLAQASFNTANTKLNSSGGTISGDLTVTGNLFVSGNTTTYTSNNVVINDPIILLANNNIGNALDIGFVAHYIESDTLKHTGLIKDVSTNTWYLLDNYTPEIQGTNLLDPNDASLRISTLKANLISNSVFINGYDALAYTQASFNKANTAASDITIIQGVNTTQNTNITNVDTKAQAAFDKANTGGEYAIDNVARLTANSASSNTIYIQGVDATQNTRITAVDTYAASAYAKANAANNLAQAAFNQANSGGGGVVSLGGFAANNVLTVNSTGYISNTTNLNFYSSNNTLVITGNVVGGGIRSTSSASPPSNPVVGDIWYETGTDVIYRYTNDGTNSYWIDVSGPEYTESLPAHRSIVEFTATANQNSFSTIYNVNSIDVLRNGLRLSTSDYVANNGTSVILTDPCNANDIVTIINFYTTSLNVVLTSNGRPSGLANGSILWNTANNVLETFVGTGWSTLAAQTLTIEYLVVAGGGGGGYDVGGGGGAGGLLTGTISGIPAGTSYAVTVGSGGAGATGNGGTAPSGSNSSLGGGVTALGGGGGANYNGANGTAVGASGGSGGGGAGYTWPSNGGAGTSGQGFAGGNGAGTTSGTGGGGGGATAAGSNGISNANSFAPGGAGFASSITGTNTTYSTGGKGGGDTWTGMQSGGANTGNGGDGLGTSGAGAGGSGIVVIRYTGAQRATGGTITSGGGYTVHTFTTSGTFTAT